jgi:hypothetical protein
MSFTITPVRLQRSRVKGARLVSPNGLPVVYVGRGSKWGNPWRVLWSRFDGYWVVVDSPDVCGPQFDAGRDKSLMLKSALRAFRKSLTSENLSLTVDDVRRELRGKNLACWCPLDGPCHADVLLATANR